MSAPVVCPLCGVAAPTGICIRRGCPNYALSIPSTPTINLMPTDTTLRAAVDAQVALVSNLWPRLPRADAVRIREGWDRISAALSTRVPSTEPTDAE